MAKVYITLHPKGGLGKSWISGLIAQYYLASGHPATCFDIDPSNASFTSYEAYGAQHLPLRDPNDPDRINPRAFDGLLETVFTSKNDDVFIVDTGSNTFMPLVEYLKETDAINFIRAKGHEIVFHTILPGGPMFAEAMEGFVRLFADFPDVQFVVWLNSFFGACDINGQTFEDSNFYHQEKDRIVGLILLNPERAQTTGHDIAQMQSHRLTFKEAIDSDQFDIMARQRLAQAWSRIWTALDTARI